MKVSKIGLITRKNMELDNQYPVQDMLIKTGQIEQFGSGVYAYGHIPLLVSKKINDIIRKNLKKIDCVEVSLPLLQPESIWKESGRLDNYVKEDVIFRCLSDKGNYCLAPTAEEAIVTYAKSRLQSYKNLPVTFFQIGPKFRNEIRTRGYLLRGKAFEMMDAYSFGKNSKDLEEDYNKIRETYFDIFNELGITVIPVNADNGSIGGSKSEEFMAISDIGEDTIIYDINDNQYYNKELLDSNVFENNNSFETKKSLELGHIFQLGTKYSKSMKATFIDEKTKPQNYVMGCYGIGTSRTLAYIYENSIIKDNNDNFKGISLPANLSPYSLYLIPKIDDNNIYMKSLYIYRELINRGIDVLYDDRLNLSIGAKIKDCKVTGTPYFAILGNKLDENVIEVESSLTGEKIQLSLDEFINLFEKYQNRDVKSKSLEQFTGANHKK